MKTAKIENYGDLLLIARLNALKSRYETLFNTAKRLGLKCKLPILSQCVNFYTNLYNRYAPDFFTKYNLPTDVFINFDLDNSEVYYEEA